MSRLAPHTSWRQYTLLALFVLLASYVLAHATLASHSQEKPVIRLPKDYQQKALKQALGAQLKRLPNESSFLLDSIKEEAADEAYEISHPLLAHAIDEATPSYQHIVQKMLKNLNLWQIEQEVATEDIRQRLFDGALQVNEPVDYWTWLFGRGMLYLDSLGEQDFVDKLSGGVLSVLEESTSPQDAFNAWGWSYVFTFYAQASLDEYYNYQEQVYASNEGTDSSASLGNWLWTRVLALQLAAVANSKPGYDHSLHALLEDAESSNQEQALKHIPRGNFRALAMSLTRLAAASMGDKLTYQALSEPVDHTIKHCAVGSDRMLASLASRITDFIYTETTS